MLNKDTTILSPIKAVIPPFVMGNLFETHWPRNVLTTKIYGRGCSKVENDEEDILGFFFLLTLEIG